MQDNDVDVKPKGSMSAFERIVYHQSAIEYNDVLAEACEGLVESVKDSEVRKWCKSIGKQHRFHSKRHKRALSKIENSAVVDEKGEVNG